jgi:hypothetical protein
MVIARGNMVEVLGEGGLGLFEFIGAPAFDSGVVVQGAGVASAGGDVGRKGREARETG